MEEWNTETDLLTMVTDQAPALSLLQLMMHLACDVHDVAHIGFIVCSSCC
ncbi:hypothetical protein DsansV1_C17g0148191 [Dioscorea sansibarensis]